MLTIGEVAKEVGINIGAIRFYERKGLLEPAARSEQNNRLYTEHELKWLVFIKCPERIKLIQDQKQKLLDDIEEKKAQLVHLEQKLERYYRGENY